MSMTVIEHIEVGSGGAASIEFTAISGDYTDLLLVTSIRNDRSASASEMKIYFNGNTSNFSTRYLGGEGTTVASGAISGRGFTGAENGNTSTANTFASTQIYIPNYTSSNAKTFSVENAMENNSTDANRYLVAGLWSTTDAITSLKIESGFNYLQYSSATLYGITAGSDGTTIVS